MKQENRNMMPVRKLLEQADVLVIVRVQIAVAACAADTLQGVDDNKFRGRMLGQKLLDLLLQSVLERVGQNCKMQRRRGIFRQVKEPRLDTLERIFKTEIQRFSLRCCEIPERLPLRNA